MSERALAAAACGTNVAGVNDKEIVLETVRQLPEASSLEEISEEIAILAAILRGEQAADAGRIIPHAEVRKMLESWTTK